MSSHKKIIFKKWLFYLFQDFNNSEIFKNNLLSNKMKSVLFKGGNNNNNNNNNNKFILS